MNIICRPGIRIHFGSRIVLSHSYVCSGISPVSKDTMAKKAMKKAAKEDAAPKKAMKAKKA